jgi:hypothetical protein
MIARLLQGYFLFITIAGLMHAIYIKFSFLIAYDKSSRFAFFVFEFPHSAAVFSASLLPIYYKSIQDGLISKINYFIVYAGLPVALMFAGARIGIIMYIVCMVFTALLSYMTKRSWLIMIIVISVLGLALASSPLYEQLTDMISVPMNTYLDATSGYSVNSLHTRAKVWKYMVYQLLDANQLYTGFGWRAWDLQYLSWSGFVSSQSDYITILFDVGLLGLLGFILYRSMIVSAFVMDSIGDVREPLYLLAGVVGSLYTAGLTENIEGYSSTSWLIPVLIGLSHSYSARARRTMVSMAQHQRNYDKVIK